jgi:hypothetical protein
MLKNEDSFTMILDIDRVFSVEDVNILNQTISENKDIKSNETDEVLEKESIKQTKKIIKK